MAGLRLFFRTIPFFRAVLAARRGPSGVASGESRPRRGERGRGSQSEFDLLGDAESVVHLDPEIANGAFQLRVPKQQLDGAKVASLLL